MLVRAEEQGLVLDLQGAIDRALAQRPAVKAAAARVAVAAVAEDVARTQYRPQVVFDTQVTHLFRGAREILTAADSAAVTRRTRDFYAASLTLGVPMVREGNVVTATLPSERRAAAELRATEFAQQHTHQDVILDASLAFFEALLQTRRVEVAASQVQATEQLYAVARQSFQLGLITRSDLLSAEVALAKSAAESTAARNDLAASLAVLAGKIGLELTTPIRVVAPSFSPSPLPPLAELLKTATQQNPQIAAQQSQIERATAELRREKSGRYPELTFFTRYQIIDNFDFSLNFEELSTSLRLNWRLFDFGATTARINQRLQDVAVATADLDVVKGSVTEEVVQQYTQVLNAEARIPPAQKQVEQTQEALRLAQARFRQNLAPQSEVLERQAQLTEAQKGLLSAQYDLQVNYARLRRSLSGDWYR